MNLHRMTKVQLIDEIRRLQAERKGRPAARGSVGTEHECLREELEIYRIELEMQNHQLRTAQAALEESRDRYAELYDLAPVGYVTFDAMGAIHEINLTGAVLLGTERRRLIGRPFALYLAPEDRESFYRHLRECRQQRQAAAELCLTVRHRRIPVQLETVVVSRGTDAVQYQSAILDMTERKRIEDDLRQARDQMELRVQERTAELVQTIGALQHQMAERAEVEAQLTASREQLRALSTRLLSIQEQERSRIALEIHDELGQCLTALKMDLTWILQRLDPAGQEALRDKGERMSALVDSTIHVVRRIARQLRPRILDDFGLVAAIESQVQEFQERTGLECRLQIGRKEFTIASELSTVVFRIFQEALTNVARHAQAKKLGVRLKIHRQSLVLQVQDDGRGITAAQAEASRSLGIIGMRERVLPWGGELRIGGAPGKGTTIELRIPLDTAADGSPPAPPPG
jgi:PAS domain S-box-containing protein